MLFLIFQDVKQKVSKATLFSYLPKNTIIWINNAELLFDDQLFEEEDKYLDKTVKNVISKLPLSFILGFY